MTTYWSLVLSLRFVNDYNYSVELFNRDFALSFMWLNFFLFTHAPCSSVGQHTDFLPTPLVVVWVNRWTFSPPPPPHHQLFVSLRYRKCCGVWQGGIKIGNIQNVTQSDFNPSLNLSRGYFDEIYA